MKLLKEDRRGKVFETDCCKIFYRNKESISGDNKINPHEKIILIQGKAKITLGDYSFNATAPFEFEIEEKMYHKIEALSDIVFLVLN